MNRLLITGATGSLGSAVIERLAGRYQIVAQGRDERRLGELAARYSGLIPLHGDLRSRVVRDATAGVNGIVHAAAQKYADKAESDCFATIDLNVNCTRELAKLAAESGVGRFVLVGSDKSVSPSGVYGITKYLAERVVLELAAHNSATSFAVCRLSNVFGSRGSVIQLWTNICRGPDPVLRVTDPAMTRFMLSPVQASDTIAFALEQARNGDVIVPKCRSVVIGELAALFPEARVQILGPRPGERQHELQHPGGEERGFESADYYIFNRNGSETLTVPRLDSAAAERVPLAELRAWLESLQTNTS